MTTKEEEHYKLQIRRGLELITPPEKDWSIKDYRILDGFGFIVIFEDKNGNATEPYTIEKGKYLKVKPQE